MVALQRLQDRSNSSGDRCRNSSAAFTLLDDLTSRPIHLRPPQRIACLFSPACFFHELEERSIILPSRRFQSLAFIPDQFPDTLIRFSQQVLLPVGCLIESHVPPVPGAVEQSPQQFGGGVIDGSRGDQLTEFLSLISSTPS